MIKTATGGLIQHSGVRQFAKFCIIGASSAVIDIGIFSVLSHSIHPIAARVISVLLAVINGFIWNSMWTFRGMGVGRRHEQFVKFLAINMVGLGLNLAIMQSIFFLCAGRFLQDHETDKRHMYLGLAVAIVIVSCWNFVANKKWTFSGSPTTA